MRIIVQTVGRFKEVVFCDFEDPEVRAQSGLLDADEARDLSQQLHSVADRLHQAELADDNQTLLPFFPLASSARAAASY